MSVWRPIRAEWENYVNYIYFVVGTRMRVKFWMEVCCDRPTLVERHGSLYNMSAKEEALVAEICSNGHAWCIRNWGSKRVLQLRGEGNQWFWACKKYEGGYTPKSSVNFVGWMGNRGWFSSIHKSDYFLCFFVLNPLLSPRVALLNGLVHLLWLSTEKINRRVFLYKILMFENFESRLNNQTITCEWIFGIG